MLYGEMFIHTHFVFMKRIIHRIFWGITNTPFIFYIFIPYRYLTIYIDDHLMVSVRYW